MVFATMSTYLLCYPLTAILVLLGCLVAAVRLAVVLRFGVAFWGRLVFWLNGRRLRVTGRERIQLFVHEPLPRAEIALLTDDEIAEKVRAILDGKEAESHEAH